MRKTIFALSFLLIATNILAATPSYHPIATIPIGGTGGWDDLTVTPDGERLFLAQSTRVVVVDLAQNKVVGEISETGGVHAIAVAPDLNRAFTSNGKESNVSVVDASTLKTLMKTPTGQNPDAIIFEPVSREIYAFNGKSSSASVLDAKSGKLITTVSLPGKPEFATVDPKARRVFVNIEDKNRVVAIDSDSHAIQASWSLAPGEGPTGIALDPKGHHLFIGCEKLLVMLDSESGKVLDTLPIGEGVDGVRFDPSLNLVFSSNGVGTLTVASVVGTKFKKIADVKTQKGARTLALNPKTHFVYLPAAEFGPPQPGKKRGEVKPGTLKLLVFGP